MTLVTYSKTVTTRPLFAKLCNQRNIRIAVEIGCDQGVYAKQFMTLFKGDHLFCIDPYYAYEWTGIDDRTPDLLMATINLAPFDGRARIVRGCSPDVIEGLPWWVKKHLGFVYIDGSHEYPDVLADIRGWWPLLTENGILAGHDFDNTHPGVVDAVHEFAKEVGRRVRLTKETLPSWYIYKTEVEEEKNLI